MARALHAAQIEALAVGAALLGAGGGGPPDLIAPLLRRRLGGRSHPVLSLADLDPDALVVPVGVVGATQVLGERLPAGDEFTEAVMAMQRWVASPVGAVMGIEGGGLNALTGVLTAIDLGLPYLDLDLMGRALPRLDQFSWALVGLPLTPCVLSGPGGQLVVIDRADPPGLERAVRALVSAGAGWGALALRPTRAASLLDACIPGSLARASKLGRSVLSLREGAQPSDTAAALGGRLLGAGRIVDVAHRPVAGGFGRGSVTVRDNSDGAVLRIESENEYLMAVLDGEVVVTCPDLIVLLDRRDACPIPVEAARSGVEVTAVVLPAPAWWRGSQRRLGRVGPRAFGINTDPVLIQP